jgi:hypothetical protein
MATPLQEDWNAITRQFFEHLGHCIAGWGRVDDNLFTIFRACVGPLQASAIIYYKQPSLEARFTLTAELVEATIQPDGKPPGGKEHTDVTEWKWAIAGRDNLQKVRRRVAHQSVQLAIGQPLGPEEFSAALQEAVKTGVWPAPLPTYEIYARHERLRLQSKEQKPLRLPDLNRHIQEVAKLSSRLHVFYNGTFAKYARPSAP